MLPDDRQKGVAIREIVVDTETTGLDAQQGHRIVEIGCVELQRYVPTGKEFHCYINPERDIPESAQKIHGIDEAFVKDKPRFADIADALNNFFGEATLVMHNAPFDLSFLNAELQACAKPMLSNPVCDTLVLAHERYRTERVSLDALCRRYGIDLSTRTQHGALIDARLLAKVYLELRGGRQQSIGLPASQSTPAAQPSPLTAHGTHATAPRAARQPFLVVHASAEEKTADRALRARIENKQT